MGSRVGSDGSATRRRLETARPRQAASPPGAPNEDRAKYDTYQARLECLLWWVIAVPMFILAACLLYVALTL